MHILQYMFRAEQDQAIFPLFNPVHIILICCTLLLIVLIISARHKVAQRPLLQRSIEIGLALFLWSVQIVYYSWYISSGNYELSVSLPLYTCRVASIIGPLALITKNRTLKIISIYWGFYAFFAVLVPELEKYSFPHITNFIFWCGHIGLVCMFTILSTWGEAYEFGLRDLRSMLIFMVVYLGVSYPIDLSLQGNYHFFLKAPFASDVFAQLPQMVYFGVVVSMYLTVTVLTCLLGKRLYAHICTKDELKAQHKRELERQFGQQVEGNIEGQIKPAPAYQISTSQQGLYKQKDLRE